MRSLAVVLAFSSFSAFAACPNLAGKYAVCRSASGTMSGSTNMVVTQKTQNGITTYTVASTPEGSEERLMQEMVADGKPRRTVEDGYISTLTVTCSGTKLIARQTLGNPDETIVDMTQEAQKKNRVLEIDYHGTAFGQEIQDTMICE